jgi:hypothetical protein
MNYLHHKEKFHIPLHHKFHKLLQIWDRNPYGQNNNLNQKNHSQGYNCKNKYFQIQYVHNFLHRSCNLLENDNKAFSIKGYLQ